MKNQPRNRPDAAKTRKSAPGQKNSNFQPLPEDEVWIWGTHAADAALKNPLRTIKQALVSRNAAQKLGLNPDALPAFARLEEPRNLDHVLPAGAVHQGVALRAAQLDGVSIEEIADACEGPVIILDQVTDPQNVGAIFRSAAAFGAKAVVMQTRKSPPLMGALAKAAAGAVDIVPEVRAVNIARAIDALTDAGWTVIGMAGETDTPIEAAFKHAGPVAIVMGAEGSGLRPAVAKACTGLARIPIHADMESLNVSNAAAISLYEATRTRT